MTLLLLPYKRCNPVQISTERMGEHKFHLQTKLSQTHTEVCDHGGSSQLLLAIYQRAQAMMWRLCHLDGLFVHLEFNENMTLQYGKLKKCQNLML